MARKFMGLARRLTRIFDKLDNKKYEISYTGLAFYQRIFSLCMRTMAIGGLEGVCLSKVNIR